MIPDSVQRERRAARLALLRMVLVVLAVGALVPWLANAYWIKTLTSSLALAIAASGAALLYGQLGLVSLCQYALLGVGGWVALRVGHGLHWPFEACVLAGGLAAGAVGMLAGLPALRLKGLYLALVTLMLAGGFQVVISATGFPDGGAGLLGRISGSERLMLPRPAIAQGEGAYFAYVAAWLAAT
jgi:branched-chain amino acid transport system permease protein